MALYDNIREWQTRLVLLHPSSDDTARLELSLVVVDLVESSVGVAINHEKIIAYDALSYTWGTADPSVECVCNGTVILLRDNLASALRHLRNPHSERYVWVDYLCINQQNEQEKDFQIPHMQTIYSRASAVMIWLGDSPVIGGIAERCRQDCGPDTELLVCGTHKEKLWVQIMEFEWFQRTWVRQEVYAARSLKVCTHHFVVIWELFTRALNKDMWPYRASFNQGNLENHRSLNEAYQSLGHFERQTSVERLLSLLKQGRCFQASRVQDHIFSILGMVPLPKGRTSLIPITSGKSYKELCGDVTRLIIGETGHIGILKLCHLQSNTSYAFDWPMVNWSSQGQDEVTPEDLTRAVRHNLNLIRDSSSDLPQRNRCDDWFIVENPIRDAVDLNSPVNASLFSERTQRIETRHLVLYGKIWGTLSLLSLRSPRVYVQEQHPVYLAEDEEYDSELVSTEVEHKQVATFIVYKRGLIRMKRNSFGARLDIEGEALVRWKCCGNVRQGDLFVSLEPGPRNVLLRNAPGNAFDIVGWGGVISIGDLAPYVSFRDIEDRSAYSVATVWQHKFGWNISTNGPPGPERQFKIR